MIEEKRISDEAVEGLARELVADSGLPYSWEKLEAMGDGKYADGFRERARKYLSTALQATPPDGRMCTCSADASDEEMDRCHEQAFPGTLRGTEPSDGRIGELEEAFHNFRSDPLSEVMERHGLQAPEAQRLADDDLTRRVFESTGKSDGRINVELTEEEAEALLTAGANADSPVEHIIDADDLQAACDKLRAALTRSPTEEGDRG